MRNVAILTLALALSLAGCGDDDPAVDSGPGTLRDASTSGSDAGTDASTPTEDAGTPMEDAGTPTGDAGPPDAGMADLFPDGLSCTTLSLCSTYDADPSRVEPPDGTGGTLRDGLYRAVQGSSVPLGLAIWDGNYAFIFENLSVSFGEASVDGATLTLRQTTACAFGVETAVDFGTGDEFLYFADGDELYTYSGCDSLDPSQCGSGTRYERVGSLCDGLDRLSCEDGGCNCATFDDVIPERPAGGTCAFE
ncbi:MAG: hypothetical protein AB8I08_36515 [Sandaracinaceae bacterium]